MDEKKRRKRRAFTPESKAEARTSDADKALLEALTTAEAEELTRLPRENERLAMECDILKLQLRSSRRSANEAEHPRAPAGVRHLLAKVACTGAEIHVV